MDLHGQIMNLDSKPENMDSEPNARLAYKVGHRDARHAAAELALKADAKIAQLRQALTTLMCHLPTDSDMIELDWHLGFIEAACRAHDTARAAVGAA